MLPFPMSRVRHPLPRPELPPMSVRVPSSLGGETSGEWRAFSRFSLFPFNFKLSTLNRFPVTPFPATLTSLLQTAENATTLSPAVATLTERVKHKSFVCHSCKKHPGVGIPHKNFPLLHSSIFSVNSALSVPSALNSLSPISADSQSASSQADRSTPRYTSRIANPRRIRTYEKRGGGRGSYCCPERTQNEGVDSGTNLLGTVQI